MFEKYDAYKDSGDKWIGNISTDWFNERLGTILEPVSIRGNADKDLLSITREKGVILRDVEDDSENHNFIPDDLSNYKLIQKGQFGMNKMKAWQGSYGVSPYTGIVSPAYYVFRFIKPIYPDFFHWAIRSKTYISFFGSASDGVRIGQWDLSKDRMKNIPFVFPDIDSQKKIIDFIQDKAEQIDQAIEIKKQQIALLNERKQIVIQKAVTQGLEPNVPMKDSGVEWIGPIPEHWMTSKVRYIGTTQNGISAGGEYFGSGYPFVSYGDVYKNRVLPVEVEGLAQSTLSDQESFSVQEGDIFFTRTSETIEEIGFTSVCFKTIDKAVFAGFLIRFRPSKKAELLKEFSKYYFSSAMMRIYFVKEMNLVIRASLNQDLLKNLDVLLPPISEQKQIFEYLENVTGKIDLAISVKQSEIEKLKEYKTTLINDAVIGKIKVA